jgi:hypothetical protein
MPQVHVLRRFRPQPTSERQLLAQIEPMLLQQRQFIYPTVQCCALA